MPSEKRFAVSRNSIALGPGTYDTPSKVGEGPKCSIRPKTAMPKRPEIPGPGKYDPTFNAVTRRTGTAIAGTEKRGKLFGKKEEVPAPGTYYEAAKKRSGPAFSFSRSKELKPKDTAPGPGTYKLPSGIANWPNYVASKKNCEYQYI